MAGGEWTPPASWPIYRMGRFECSRCGLTIIDRPNIKTTLCRCGASASRVLVAEVPCPPISPLLKVEHRLRGRAL